MSKKQPPAPSRILSPPPPPPHQPKKQPPPRRKILSPPPHPPPSPPQPPLQQPLPPPSPSTGDNKTYRDCIPGICSINCPQFCTFLPFPPPPPFFFNSATSDDDSNKISPLMATLIAVLATAFLLLFYYAVISRYLRRRRHLLRHRRRHLADVTSSSEIRLDPLVQEPTRPAGIEDSFIRQITVFKYRRGDGLVEGTECAICLSEFSENESLRLMPNCEHAFHIPCIDTWLRSHSNCPLCRSGMDPVDPVRPDPSRAGGVMLAHMRIHRSDDAVLVVTEEEGEVIVCHDIEERENGEIKTNPSLLL